MTRLLTAAHLEHVENIKRARENAVALDLNQIRPYESKAFLAMVKAAKELIGLAETTAGS